MSEGVPAADAAKRAAGEHAARYVETGMRVGLGTGSTVRYTIEALAASGLDIVCTATSRQTEVLAEGLGMRLALPDELGALDVCIDGADEVDPDLNLTKGGGGAHTREKIVAGMAARFVVVVDESKLVPRLGPFGTPLEVLDFAPGVVAGRVQLLGATEVTTRAARSDSGNLLLDARFAEIPDPVALGRALSEIPGIVEHGLFPGSMVERVVVAGSDGVRELTGPVA
jgi:ribose 5-phosphate isomerase A